MGWPIQEHEPAMTPLWLLAAEGSEIMAAWIFNASQYHGN